MIDWLPIETAPKDNKCPLLLAYFNENGELEAFDYNGVWEILLTKYEWLGDLGSVDEPTHWAYQPEGFAKLTKKANK